MLKSILAAWLIFSTITYAGTTDVPTLPNGKVDVDAVYSSFSVQVPVYSTGPGLRFKGSVLGKPFVSEISAGSSSQQFILTVLAPELSEHGVYVTAIMLNGIICHQRDLYMDRFRWKETASRVENGWQVTIACRQDSLGNGS